MNACPCLSPPVPLPPSLMEVAQAAFCWQDSSGGYGLDPSVLSRSPRYSTPVLWDKKHGTIVCNESKTILRILNSAFGGLAKHPHLNFFPEDKAAEMQELDDFIYPTINNGVYRCGFAKSQQAYETAFDELFASLDRVENILSSKRLAPHFNYCTSGWGRPSPSDTMVVHATVPCALCISGCLRNCRFQIVAYCLTV